jgi:hypothetical protein
MTPAYVPLQQGRMFTCNDTQQPVMLLVAGPKFVRYVTPDQRVLWCHLSTFARNFSPAAPGSSIVWEVSK